MRVLGSDNAERPANKWVCDFYRTNTTMIVLGLKVRFDRYQNKKFLLMSDRARK